MVTSQDFVHKRKSDSHSSLRKIRDGGRKGGKQSVLRERGLKQWKSANNTNRMDTLSSEWCLLTSLLRFSGSYHLITSKRGVQKVYLPIFHGRGSKDVQVSFYFLINTSQLEISTGGQISTRFALNVISNIKSEALIQFIACNKYFVYSFICSQFIDN